MTLSMSTLGDQTVALLRRESRLMVPLALATIGIGSAVSTLTQNEIMATGRVSGPMMIGFILATLLTLLGTLAVMALALTHGLSVGEALKVGRARLLKMLGIAVVFGIMISLLLIPLAIIVQASGVDLDARPPQLPPLAIVYALVAAMMIFYAGVRMITLNALIVDRNPPMLDAVKASFAATRGIAGKLIGVTVLFLIVAIALGGATTAIFGLLFVFVGKVIGAPFAGTMMAALIGGMVSAGLSLVSTVFTACLYRALSGSSAQ